MKSEPKLVVLDPMGCTDLIFRKNGVNAAFKEWLRKLQPRDKLPRGKFFKGKRSGGNGGGV